MIEVIVTREFEIRYRDLPKAIQRKAEKQERLFRKNLFLSITPHRKDRAERQSGVEFSYRPKV